MYVCIYTFYRSNNPSKTSCNRKSHKPRQLDVSREILCAQASVQEQKSSHISLKPLIGFRVGFFTMVQEWFIKPRGNTRIWFTSKSQKKHFPVLPISLAILRVSSILQSSSSSFHQGGCSGLRSGMGRSSSFSSLFALVGEMARVSRLDPFASLRPSGVEGAA